MRVSFFGAFGALACCGLHQGALADSHDGLVEGAVSPVIMDIRLVPVKTETSACCFVLNLD